MFGRLLSSVHKNVELSYNLERAIPGRQFALSESKASPRDYENKSGKKMEKGRDERRREEGEKRKRGLSDAEASSQLITSSQ